MTLCLKVQEEEDTYHLAEFRGWPWKKSGILKGADEEEIHACQKGSIELGNREQDWKWRLKLEESEKLGWIYPID